MFNPNIDKQIEIAARAMTEGELTAFPTDTVYGIGCSSLDDQAIANLYALKGRPPGLRLPLLLADLSQIEQVAPIIPESAAMLAAKYWPGPLTIIIPCHAHVNRRITGDGGSVALRVPGHYVPRKLAELVGCPIIGTSANRSGEPSCTTYQEVIAAFPSGLASVLDGGVSHIGVESTIVDCTSAEIQVVRQGSLDISADLQ